jgi:SAM-dependent methyltransferase
MHYKSIGNKVATKYDSQKSSKYRKNDERSVTYPGHKRRCQKLKDICNSFSHNISVLDLGCGTGKYFFCLTNTKYLMGIDISEPMLEEAKNPVKSDRISIPDIELKCANIFTYDLDKKFDFIYSMGVLGEHSPFDTFICNKIYHLLEEGGIAYFSIVDAKSKKIRKSVFRKLIEMIHPLIPMNYYQRLQQRWRKFYLTKEELEETMKNSPFKSFDITHHIAQSANWSGAHFECMAVK